MCKNSCKVVFLDRDGTMNVEVNYLHRKEDLKLIDGTAEAVRLLNEAGYKVIVITNQAGVARGYYTEADVKILHDYMNEVLERDGAHVDAFYYCPHHPEHGIGDKRIDVQAGKNFGVTGVLVGTGYGAKEHAEDRAAGLVKEDGSCPAGGYDAYAETLLDAVRGILGGRI